MTELRANQRPSRLIILWGVLGVVVMLLEAIYRLSITAISLIREHGLTTAQLIALLVWVILICYAEGYRGFQRHFSPRVVVRAIHLGKTRHPLHVALAPLFCMALFHASRYRVIVNWCLAFGIVTLILLVRALPPLYRAIVDAGVACALLWGTISIVVYLVKGLQGQHLPVPADIPGDATQEGTHRDQRSELQTGPEPRSKGVHPA